MTGLAGEKGSIGEAGAPGVQGKSKNTIFHLSDAILIEF